MPDEHRLTPAPGQGPIFILGAMGSGTTLLRLVLDSHERIAIPPETGFMRAYNAHMFIPFKWTGMNWARRMGWSRRELIAQLREFYDTIFMRYATMHGKQRWGEKTPLHTWHVDSIAKLFPDAVFIGIVRHPGGSVASNMRRWSHSLRRSSQHYTRYNKEIIRQAARHKDRFVLLRYEELLLQPEPVLRELLDWLGEPWSDSVLKHDTVQASRGGKTIVEGKNRVDDPIDVSRIDKWIHTLDARQRRALRPLARLGEFLGYTIGDPASFAVLNDRNALLLGGQEVDARIERFPDLDLRTQGRIPRYETIYHPREWTLAPAEPPSARRVQPQQRSVAHRAAVAVVTRLPPPMRRRVVTAGRRGRRAVRRRLRSRG